MYTRWITGITQKEKSRHKKVSTFSEECEGDIKTRQTRWCVVENWAAPWETKSTTTHVHNYSYGRISFCWPVIRWTSRALSLSLQSPLLYLRNDLHLWSHQITIYTINWVYRLSFISLWLFRYDCRWSTFSLCWTNRVAVAVVVYGGCMTYYTIGIGQNVIRWQKTKFFP